MGVITKTGMIDYFSELPDADARYFRGNFGRTRPTFAADLQRGRSSGVYDSAGLSCHVVERSLYGIYRGRVSENAALPGPKREYLDSGKKYRLRRAIGTRPQYQEFIARLNTIQAQNRALQFLR